MKPAFSGASSGIRRIVALMQFNMYHHYTVDEHLLRAVGNLAELEAQRLIKELPLASEIVPSIANRKALFLALFLHDIARGGWKIIRVPELKSRVALSASRPYGSRDRNRGVAGRDAFDHVGYGAAA